MTLFQSIYNIIFELFGLGEWASTVIQDGSIEVFVGLASTVLTLGVYALPIIAVYKLVRWCFE